MKKLILLLIVLTGILLPSDVINTKNGLIFKIEKTNVNEPNFLKIDFITDNIVHIQATRKKQFIDTSLIILNNCINVDIKWNYYQKNNSHFLETQRIIIKVDNSSSMLTFFNKKGEIILQEANNGKIIKPIEFPCERAYSIQQIFKTHEDEAFFGLGHHQLGIMNYRGHDIDLWQHNMIAVVPFIVSSRNYGILWDNYSRTKFGDPRDYISIEDLNIVGIDGKTPGLTAEYFSDRDFNKLYLKSQEQRIQHKYLDVNDPFPKDFGEKIKSVRWSGFIKPEKDGVYKFRLYCSGYTKMWINDELIVNNWRQNWLPWYHFKKLHMKKGNVYKIKIEWIHDGGFIGLEYLPPSDTDYADLLSLWSEVADEIDYYFIYGETIYEIIKGYRLLTGKAPLMPKWVAGYWQSRERYKTQDELLGVLDEYRKRKIPIDNIVLDWFYWPENKWGSHDFDRSRFPDPEEMVRTVHENYNAHIMISIWPKFYVGTKHYEEMLQNGFLYLRNIQLGQKDWVGYVSTFYDPYHEGARDLYWKQIKEKLVPLGFDAWWLDATEPDIHSNLSMEETVKRNGPTGLGPFRRYRNIYSLFHTKGIYENSRKTLPNKRVFILTRSAFAGQQKYSAAVWSGDVAARWFDLKNQIPAGLNMCLSGIPYWTMDIGGFAVENRIATNPKTDDLEEWRELFTRWFQFGAFCPIFRAHGQYPYREIYNIASHDHPAYKSMVYYDKLRYRLIPYIYSLYWKITKEDYTIMRALIFDFPNDKNVVNIADQYMFGPYILVCPVTEYKARSRNVYLPETNGWYDFYSGNFYKAGNSYKIDAPYERIPLFIKAGAIIPAGPEIQFVDEKAANPIRLFIYGGEDASFTLYEDEGDNYNYEKGAYSEISFKYNDKDKTLRIFERKGKYPGMIQNRIFEIIYITPDNPKPFNFKIKPDKTAIYKGKQIKLKLE